MKLNSLKYKIIVLFLAICGILQHESASAKETTFRDTLATIAITDIKYLNTDELGFKIRLIKHSERWLSFVNGTYQISFDAAGLVVNPDSVEIKFTGVTDLRLMVSAGNETLPKTDYIVRPTISKNNRISIYIAGPEEFKNSIYVPKNDSGIVLGEFVLKSKNGFNIPNKLRWEEPTEFFQACAYKLDKDTLLAPGIVWHNVDDNLEMSDTVKHFVNYISNNVEEKFVLDYFKVIYEGQKVVSVQWKTSSEPYNEGFILKRGLRRDKFMPHDSVTYNEIIAYHPKNMELKGTGKNGLGGLYFWLDTVPYRNVDYCYQLEYKHRTFSESKDIFLARACAEIPNAVIFAASAAPNPFVDKTNINFWLEDDSYVTAVVKDVRGRSIRTLCTNVPYKMNMRQSPHVLEYVAGAHDATGVYEVVITALPIKDQSINRSEAFVKIQLVK